MDREVFLNACKKYCNSVGVLKRLSNESTEMKKKVDFRLHYNHGVENIIAFFNIHNPEKLKANSLTDVTDYLYHYGECNRSKKKFIEL